MNSVEANSTGQIVGQESYGIDLLRHGQGNQFTWLVHGDFTLGTYTVEVTLTYGIPSPPDTIGTATQQLTAS